MLGTYTADVDGCGDRGSRTTTVVTTKLKLSLGGDDAGAFTLGDISTDDW